MPSLPEFRTMKLRNTTCWTPSNRGRDQRSRPALSRIAHSPGADSNTIGADDEPERRKETLPA
jgi:hypothetical protein